MTEIRLEEGVEMPLYGSEFAAGADVVANSILKVYSGIKEVDGERLEKVQKDFLERGSIKMRIGERILFGTGIHILNMDCASEIQVRNRSGMALKRGILVANSPGTIECDYRGEIGIILFNTNQHLTTIEKGERVAQLVHCYTTPFKFIEGEFATETGRGSGGFGSTGTK